MSDLIDRVCSWMVAIANDNSHGYSQDSKKRWLSPDIDCSSFVILAWESQGIPVRSKYNASFTGDMKKAFINAGFQCIKFSKDLPLLKGDVLLNEVHHVVLYLGNNKVVHASSSETGGKYGKEGDQTGGEVCVRSLYTPKYGWDYVLRYTESDNKNPYPIPTVTLKKGHVGLAVAWLQYELCESGADIKIDQHFGPVTESALKNFQKRVGIEVDGICGPITRKALLDNTSVIDAAKPNKPVNPYKHSQIVLKIGSKGESVKWLQWELNYRIDARLSEDGSFGKLTEQKVIEFQKSVFPNKPNEWDGIVGPKTRSKLEN